MPGPGLGWVSGRVVSEARCLGDRPRGRVSHRSEEMDAISTAISCPSVSHVLVDRAQKSSRVSTASCPLP